MYQLEAEKSSESRFWLSLRQIKFANKVSHGEIESYNTIQTESFQ